MLLAGRMFPTVGAALPDVALGAVYLTAWVAPGTFGSDVIPGLVLLMLLEFIIVHSSVFLGSAVISTEPPARKARGILGIGASYTLFVAGFAIGFRTWWPVISFWGLTINRLLSVLLGQAPSGEEKLFLRRSWAVTAMAYLCFAGLTTVLPLPRLGVTGAFRDGLPGSGLWISEPHRALAFGFLYFTAVGISELFGHRWLPAQGLAGASNGSRPERGLS